ncbi:TetR/AcrR family transcriptional regulator [Herbiconiux sp. P17]|uniref:TetR/AcrR family transcriptional regulator n=1 Tax=Herbiconiux wuyangfengii TaxID=3342794 RepID=UPI0035B76C63
MARELSTKVKPRDRIIAAAARLYLSDGIHPVSVDRLSEEAAVSKRSLYQHFDDKYDILHEMLETVGERKLAEYLPSEEDETAPVDRILSVFDSVRELSKSPQFHGCPFVNVATELRDPTHPGSRSARRFKLLLRAFFERQSERAGVADPAATATHLTMLFDGACAYSVVQGTPIPDTVRDAATALLGRV